MPPKILRSFRADPASRSVAASHPTPVPVGSYSSSTPTPLAGTTKAIVLMPPFTSRLAAGVQLIPNRPPANVRVLSGSTRNAGAPVIFAQGRSVIHAGLLYVPAIDTALVICAAV